MPVNWIAAFKLIPWSDVIAAAPTVARTARELWRRMSKEKAAEAAQEQASGTGGAAPTAEEELRALRAELADARTQLLSVSEVLRALAEQDEKLIAAIEVLRVRTRVLAFVSAALVVVCVALILR